MTVCIDKKYWGRIAREASRHFIARIFANYKCYKLKALVYEHNRNARNFLLSLGFKKESTLLNETFKNGKPVNMSVYSVYKDTFIS
jgi:RimJ/RimL family protein N-acetyltransferase